MRCRPALIIGLAALLPSTGSVALAGIDPLTGIDFVTIDHINNAPWPGGGPGMNNFVGRGSVGYEYRIGKYEVTTAQWAEFFTAAQDRPQSEWIPTLQSPSTWGAVQVPGSVPGARRYVVPAGREMWGVGGITWRTAAIYCNWLTNGKSLAREAFLSGAYDVSTFGFNGNAFTDQLTRSAGAQYFIPTLDEWLKASHYSPERFGPGQEGWWYYSHTSDTPAIPGWPGEITPNGLAQANYGGFAPFGDSVTIPLGSYAGVTSPWGLYDTSGATAEWTEEVFTSTGGVRRRGADGSFWVSGSFTDDSVWALTATLPNTNSEAFGFRVASVVPAPPYWGTSVSSTLLCRYAVKENPMRSLLLFLSFLIAIVLPTTATLAGFIRIERALIGDEFAPYGPLIESNGRVAHLAQGATASQRSAAG